MPGKRPLAYEAAMMLLKENPGAHIITLAAMYEKGTVVPTKAIPILIKAFETAKKELAIFCKCGIDKAIAALKKQSKKKKKKK